MSWMPGLLLLALPPFVGSLLRSGALVQAVLAPVQIQPWRWPWGSLLVAAAHTGVWLLAMQAAGRPVLALGSARPRRASLRLPFAHLLGLLLAGTGLLGAGLVGLVHRPLLLAGEAVLGAVGGWEAIRRARRVRWPSRRMPAEAVPLAATSVWTIFYLAGDLAAPEVSFDSLVYHLALPARWLAEGRQAGGPPFFAHFPLLMSEHFLLALAAHGEMVARMQVVSTGVLLVAAIYGLSRRWLARGPALAAAALAACHPLMVTHAAHALADTTVALAAVLGLAALGHAVPQWPRGPARPGWLLLAAACGATAAASKPTGAMVAVVLALLVLPAGGPPAAARLAGGAVVGWLPWAVKAWWFTGSPVFPALAAGSPAWSVYGDRAYGDELAGVWNQLAPSDFTAWAGSDYAVSVFKLGLLGPFPVLAALLLPGARDRRIALPAAFVAALGCLVVFTVPAWRFYTGALVILPPLVLAAAPAGSGRWLFAAGLVLQAGWLPAKITWVDRPWEVAAGRIGPEDYYDMHDANGTRDAGVFLDWLAGGRRRSLVLATGEVHGYLLPARARGASYYDEEPLVRAAREADSPRRLQVRLRQAGVGYLLVNVPELLRWRGWHELGWDGAPPSALLEAFFREHTSLLYARRGGWVYSVMAKGEGAVLPECYARVAARSPAIGAACVTRAQAALADGRIDEAVRSGWAAVAAAEGSGLAWATLGDALFTAGNYDQATGAYSTALRCGWKTSAVYRNQAVAMAKEGRADRGQQAMTYARKVDIFSSQLRQEELEMIDAWARHAGNK